MRQHRIDTPREPDDRHLVRGAGRPVVAAPAGVWHPRAGSITELQRTAGNHVVGRLLLGGAQGAAGAPTVQRAPYGLESPKSRGAYVAEAARLRRAQPRMSLSAFAEALLTLVAGELKAAGVPPVRWTIKESGSGPDGVFSSTDWRVLVNTSAFSAQKTPPKEIGLLTDPEVTAAAGTLYHEARHADQDVVIIRDLLAQKRTVDQVVAATGIRRKTVQSVRSTTYAAPLDADQRAHAARMYDVMYGPNNQFLKLLMTHRKLFAGLGMLAEPGSRLPDGKRHVTTLATWQSTTLTPTLARLAASKNLTAAQKDLHTRLRSVDAEITALLVVWKAAHVKKPAPTAADDVRVAAGDTRDALDEAYRSLESEADAFWVEGLVAAALEQKLAKP
ncbi:hypothetical protein [Cellulomonas sp. NS3]|uniref:hypothetical protein n=1 Tax=Cellulomonas sp. NS3 TaxID=2973977 RepID=UPI002161EA99|nr:hypothetical protein [Cellulomonas sp. NS3]